MQAKSKSQNQNLVSLTVPAWNGEWGPILMDAVRPYINSGKFLPAEETVMGSYSESRQCGETTLAGYGRYHSDGINTKNGKPLHNVAGCVVEYTGQSFILTVPLHRLSSVGLSLALAYFEAVGKEAV